MKYLVYALAISFGMGMLLFGVTYPIFKDAHLAAGIGAMPIAGCHHIAEMLERRVTQQSVHARRPTEIPTLAGFVISWPAIVVYATLALFALDLFAITFGLSVMVVVFDITDSMTKTQVIAGLAVAMPILLMGGFAVGRQIGLRCAHWPRATVVLVAALGSLLAYGLTSVIDWIWPSDSGPVLGTTDTQDFLILTLFSWCNFTAGGLLGHRQGDKYRLAGYVEYLLSVLPPGTRSVLVELAYEEARKASTPSGAPASTAAES